MHRLVSTEVPDRYRVIGQNILINPDKYSIRSVPGYLAAVITLGMSAASNLMAETRGDVSHRDSLDSGSLWERLTVLKKGDSKQFSSAQEDRIPELYDTSAKNKPLGSDCGLFALTKSLDLPKNICAHPVLTEEETFFFFKSALHSRLQTCLDNSLPCASWEVIFSFPLTVHLSTQSGLCSSIQKQNQTNNWQNPSVSKLNQFSGGYRCWLTFTFFF